MRDTVGLFDAMDWVWSFRWLGLVLALLAVLGTAYLIVVESLSPDRAASGFEVVVDLHGQGTPQRGIGEIAQIFETAMQSDSLTLVSPSGTAPARFWTDKKSVAENAEAEGDRIVQLLMAEAETRVSVLTPFVQREGATEIAVSEYLKTLTFLEGVDSGLTKPFTVSVRQSPSLGRPNTTYVLLALPWVVAGIFFLMIAGAITLFGAWRRHSAQMRQTL